VYKLAAIRSADGHWQHRAKRSDDLAKATIPGIHQVRRFSGGDGLFSGDVIYSEPHGIDRPTEAIELADSAKMTLDGETHEDLLIPVFRGGERVYESPRLDEIRQRALDQISRLPAEVTRLENPRRYAVGLERRLVELRQRLLAERGA
jgi:nicotinate phosphoribosyltransferase